MIGNEGNSLYVYIKDFNKSIFKKQNIKTKNNKCHACNKLYTENNVKVRDNCLIAGKNNSSAINFAMLIIDLHKRYP